MLKRYKRLLNILGVVVFLNLLYQPVFAQGEPPAQKIICKELALPIDLFDALGIQISPSNGYWTDESGKKVGNVFDPTEMGIGDYEFTFHVTTENFCGANVGTTYDLIVEIIAGVDLKVTFSPLEPAWCGIPNGVIVIDTIESGTGDYSFMLLKEEESQYDTIVNWSPITDKSNILVNDTLSPGLYYLYVQDDNPNNHLAKTCYNYLSIDTINLAMAENSIDISEVLIVHPDAANNGRYEVEGKGGVDTLTYAWYRHSIEEDGPDFTDTLSTEMFIESEFGVDYYWVVVTDARGCDERYQIKVEDVTILLQLDYYFCQGSYIEMFSGKMIDTKTIEQLLFATAEEPVDIWDDATVVVYPSDDPNVSPEPNNAWLINAIENGYINDSDNNTIKKYVEITRKDGKVINYEIRVKIFNSPAITGKGLDLRIVNDKLEWDLDDVVKFETTPEGMAAYIYFLNNKKIDSIPASNLLDVNAMRFTGTVQDMMKVHVLEDIVMTIEHNNKDTANYCTWIVSKPVIVNIPFPNVFTPDGDGINDVFLGGDKYRNREYHLEIINRYGNRLYYGSEGWDGTYKGSEMPSGVYFYIVHLKLEDGSTKVLKGAVTLIRKAR